MGEFNLNNYEEVKDRIPRFWEDCPDGRIITELQTPATDLKIVVFKATLFDGDCIIATGWAFEKEGEGYINKTSHLENCETSAIGRALANAGYSGIKSNEKPSREEMEKVKRASAQKGNDYDL